MSSVPLLGSSMPTIHGASLSSSTHGSSNGSLTPEERISLMETRKALAKKLSEVDDQIAKAKLPKLVKSKSSKKRSPPAPVSPIPEERPSSVQRPPSVQQRPPSVQRPSTVQSEERPSSVQCPPAVIQRPSSVQRPPSVIEADSFWKAVSRVKAERPPSAAQRLPSAQRPSTVQSVSRPVSTQSVRSAVPPPGVAYRGSVNLLALRGGYQPTSGPLGLDMAVAPMSLPSLRGSPNELTPPGSAAAPPAVAIPPTIEEEEAPPRKKTPEKLAPLQPLRKPHVHASPRKFSTLSERLWLTAEQKGMSFNDTVLSSDFGNVVLSGRSPLVDVRGETIRAGLASLHPATSRPATSAGLAAPPAPVGSRTPTPKTSGLVGTNPFGQTTSSSQFLRSARPNRLGFRGSPPKRCEISMPAGVAPGESFLVRLPDGVKFEATAPPGATKGMPVQFEVPDFSTSGMASLTSSWRSESNREFVPLNYLRKCNDQAAATPSFMQARDVPLASNLSNPAIRSFGA